MEPPPRPQTAGLGLGLGGARATGIRRKSPAARRFLCHIRLHGEAAAGAEASAEAAAGGMVHTTNNGQKRWLAGWHCHLGLLCPDKGAHGEPLRLRRLAPLMRRCGLWRQAKAFLCTVGPPPCIKICPWQVSGEIGKHVHASWHLSGGCSSSNKACLVRPAGNAKTAYLIYAVRTHEARRGISTTYHWWLFVARGNFGQDRVTLGGPNM